MTKQAKKEYVNEQRPRYLACEDKRTQTALLDEIVKVTRWNRKYLIRVLRSKPKPAQHRTGEGPKKSVGAPRQYDAPEIDAFLVTLWHASGQACGKRLKGILTLWLPWYEQASGVTLSLEHQVLLSRISAATIDRRLAPERAQYRAGKGRCTTKPGTLLKHQIPYNADQWEERRPGFVEGDTVAHCGMSMAGMFVYSLNVTDIASTWTEARAVWGKGETGVVNAVESIEQNLPFPLYGFDSDNGGEFLNHHLATYFRQRKRRVRQTRSREYKKNDNAHIEQKNWTHIRQLFGYERFDNPDVVPLMNDVYAKEFSLLRNFFLPSVKLVKKMRIGSTTVKQHDRPQTPCQRLLKMRSIPQEMKERLRFLQRTLNPFVLHRDMQRKVKKILSLCSLRSHGSLSLPTKAAPSKMQSHKPPAPKPNRRRREATPLALRARSVASR